MQKRLHTYAAEKIAAGLAGRARGDGMQLGSERKDGAEDHISVTLLSPGRTAPLLPPGRYRRITQGT